MLYWYEEKVYIHFPASKVKVNDITVNRYAEFIYGFVQFSILAGASRIFYQPPHTYRKKQEKEKKKGKS